MISKIFVLSVVVVLFALTLVPLTPPAAAQETEGAAEDKYIVLDDVIAWVGSEYITRSEYDFEIMRQRKMLEQSELTAEQREKALVDFDRQVFDSLVERLLILAAGEEAGLRVPDYEMDLFLDNFIQQNDGIDSLEDLDEALKRYGSNLQSFKRESRQGLMMEKVRKNLIFPRIEITEEEIRETYMSHQESFLIPAWVRLEEIVLNATELNREQVRERAIEILTDLRSGERSFPDTARLISNGASAEEGGNLGSIPLDDLSGALRQVVDNLEEGGVSDPIETAAGVQIVRVAEKHPATFKPLLEVEDVIRDTLLRERQMDEQVKFIGELREKAYIKIYPEELQ
jgi:parvulin-like peptidyl-prolyl isomerase